MSQEMKRLSHCARNSAGGEYKGDRGTLLLPHPVLYSQVAPQVLDIGSSQANNLCAMRLNRGKVALEAKPDAILNVLIGNRKLLTASIKGSVRSIDEAQMRGVSADRISDWDAAMEGLWGGYLARSSLWGGLNATHEGVGLEGLGRHGGRSRESHRRP